MIAAPGVLHTHFICTLLLSVVLIITYLVMPLIYGQTPFYVEPLWITFISFFSLYLASDKCRQTRVEFYETQVANQNLTMLKSELGQKKKKVVTEELFTNSPIQSIISSLRTLLDTIPEESRDVLDNVIKTLLTSKDLYKTQLNDSVNGPTVDSEFKRYLQTTADVMAEEGTQLSNSGGVNENQNQTMESVMGESVNPNSNVLLQQIISKAPVMNLLNPSWEFDILEFNEIVSGNSLSTIFLMVMTQNKLGIHNKQFFFEKYIFLQSI